MISKCSEFFNQLSLRPFYRRSLNLTDCGWRCKEREASDSSHQAETERHSVESEVARDHTGEVRARETEEASENRECCYELPQRPTRAGQHQEDAGQEVGRYQECIPAEPSPISHRGK